jgi:hypothetical protein
VFVLADKQHCFDVAIVFENLRGGTSKNGFGETQYDIEDETGVIQMSETEKKVLDQTNVSNCVPVQLSCTSTKTNFYAITSKKQKMLSVQVLDREFVCMAWIHTVVNSAAEKGLFHVVELTPCCLEH